MLTRWPGYVETRTQYRLVQSNSDWSRDYYAETPHEFTAINGAICEKCKQPKLAEIHAAQIVA